MSKNNLTERDICTKYITPALIESGWNLHSQFREEVTFFTNGRIYVHGKMVRRGEQKRADYILYYKPNIPIAIIEAKDNKHSIGDGMQQGLSYAEILDIPFVYSTNGDGFLEHDPTLTHGVLEKEISLGNFPSPDELWQRYKKYRGIEEDEAEKVALSPYYIDDPKREPRYYQKNAINRTIEAIAKGQKRILLVMATGTGKTYTAFQIIYRLYKSRKAKRILFLADRNILVDQTKIGDFKHFGDKMTKVTNRTIDKSFEIYLSLYQAITGNSEEKKIFKEFSRDFFDLIVIDEAHRGSAAEDSQWREILEYFYSAVQIGLTATPKETKYVSNISYFGEPVYTYSLKQGIDDGFLAPYKVIRLSLDKDVEGWRPYNGQTDDKGEEIEDREYNTKDFDKNLILTQRTNLVAKKVTEYLNENDPYMKTIIFCVDIDHAERMRQALVNANPAMAKESRKYVMRITGDNDEGKKELDNFIDPESTYPVIATTSKLMTTGVDAQTTGLIVLDSNIGSMTEFKQIIGRGTRINETYGKLYFTIMDFRNVTRLFADPDFDGDPVQIYEPKDDDPITPPDEEVPEEFSDTVNEPSESYGETPDVSISEGENGTSKPTRHTVSGVKVKVLNKRVQYIGADGKLITESLVDYSRKNIKKAYASLDEFLQEWSTAEQKEAIIKALSDQGVFFDELESEVGKEGLDPFDLICHIAFDRPALTRAERAGKLKKNNYFDKYTGIAKEVINALLDKYTESGIESIEDISVLKVPPFNEYGTMKELTKLFGGGRAGYQSLIKEIEQHLYAS